MAKRFDTSDLALLIATKEERRFGDHYFHILLTVVRREGNSLRNLSCSGPDVALADLELSAQGGGISNHPQMYGFSTEFRNVFSVDAARAQAMAKTLTTLQRKLGAYTDAAGPAKDFAEYVSRVSEALGIATFAEREGPSNAMYSDCTYRFMGRGYHDMQAVVRKLEQDWITRQTEAA